MKIVTILGARPQFIKAATVSRALRSRNLREVIIHTGQHFDPNMSDIFFNEMEIPKPDHFLEVNRLGHGAMTGRMLEKIETVLESEKPSIVLVYGDTNSTLAGALAATKLHIPVAHVEAGLRSFDMRMPEEVNRVLTDRISKILFCPTAVAVENLKKEGFDHLDCTIEQPGDVMFDAVLYYRERSAKTSTITSRLGLDGPFALATLHRAENTDDPERLRSIVLALNEIHASMQVVMPLHPRTRGFLDSHRIPLRVKAIDPTGYLDMLMLLDRCGVVLTDSGGLQKEAYYFNKYCITLRDQTEWIELVRDGANVLAGADREKILAAFRKANGHKVSSKPYYGSGDASQKIADRLSSH